MGMPGMHGMYWNNIAITESDLLVAIGMRFDDRVTGRLKDFAPHAKIIHIDIDPAEIGKNVKPTVPIVGRREERARQPSTSRWSPRATTPGWSGSRRYAGSTPPSSSRRTTSSCPSS